jgi:hypothetical protein
MSNQEAKSDGHIDFVCPGEHEDGGWSCMFCAGGLSACTRCRAFEGAWPDECPGKSMTEEQYNAVYAGTLNFRDGQWREDECCRVMMPSRHPEEFLRQVETSQRRDSA